VWPVTIGYFIEYQTQEIAHTWRAVLFYSLFSKEKIYSQRKRIYSFNTKFRGKATNILMNNRSFYVAEEDKNASK